MKLPQSDGNLRSRAPRVLIVEDSLPYAHALMRSLREAQYPLLFEVDLASNISEVLPYLDRDEIDIYVVDLALPEKPKDIDLVENGKKLVGRIYETSDAGILVHTNTPLWRDGEELFALGADDYIEKGTAPEILRAQATALWRRIRMTRASSNSRIVHTNQVFCIRDWQFVVGDRLLHNSLENRTVRLSPTEHAFLCYLCTADDHKIDRREFNVGILGRPAHKQDQRIDNIVYQINKKLGMCVQNISKEDSTYRLFAVKELRAS